MSIVAIAGAAALWVGLKRGTLSLVLPLIRRMPVIERGPRICALFALANAPNREAADLDIGSVRELPACTTVVLGSMP
jgi:hypothetical protein